MWNQFDELSEDHVFDNAFLVKTVFRVSNSSGMVSHIDNYLKQNCFGSSSGILFMVKFNESGSMQYITLPQAFGDPKLTAYYNNKKCAIAVDETLCIFDKEQFLDGKNLTFEAKIDCLTVAESMVICGLANGCIYGVHISGVPLFSS